MIATVAFDADETLIDIRSAVEAAYAALVSELAVPELTVEMFRADGVAAWAQWPQRPAGEIRAEATRRTLARFGLDGDLKRVVERFFEVRYANSKPFDGVIDVLEKLRPEYQLGYATNANSDAHRCGLKDKFDFEIYALRTGVPKKPAAEFYQAVAMAAGRRPEEIVYVGDSYEHDIVGPAGYGMRTVWLNRAGGCVPGQTQPDAVIDNLMDLPRILAGWR